MITIFSECNITVVQSVSYFEETSADDLFVSQHYSAQKDYYVKIFINDTVGR